MYDINQFRNLIIQPALQAITLPGQSSLYTAEAEELLVATCAQESLGGTYVAQQNNDNTIGPAYGCYQMEDKTYDSLWNNFLQQKSGLGIAILQAANYKMRPKAFALMQNVAYATMMARIFYMQFNSPLPAADDIESIWAYYKQYWNTNQGAATHDAFLANYYRFTGKEITKGKSSMTGPVPIPDEINYERPLRGPANHEGSSTLQSMLLEFIAYELLRYSRKDSSEWTWHDSRYPKKFSIILEVPDDPHFNTRFDVNPKKKDGHITQYEWPLTWSEYRAHLLKQGKLNE